jgi:succinate dehydrogenase / fumarate reductase membrane anchor subunit
MKNDTTSIRSPLGRARGLGSAKDGTHHWWMQRLSAIALTVPMIYLLCNIDHIVSPDYAAFLAWLKQPAPAIALVLFIVSSFYHAALGLQVVIEDYVHTRWMETTLQIAVKFVAFLGAILATLSVIRIALGN